jgi:hypothetical protein
MHATNSYMHGFHFGQASCGPKFVNPYSQFGQILFFFRTDIQSIGGLQFKEGMFDALLALSG